MRRLKVIAFFSGLILLSGVANALDNNSLTTTRPATHTQSQHTLSIDNTSKQPEDISTPENIKKFDELKDGDFTTLQQATVKRIKKKLPVLVDEYTLLVDVTTKDNALYYKYIVKGAPLDILQSEDSTNKFKQMLKTNYCNKIDNKHILYKVFPSGSVYNYSTEGKQFLKYKVTPADCR